MTLKFDWKVFWVPDTMDTTYVSLKRPFLGGAQLVLFVCNSSVPSCHIPVIIDGYNIHNTTHWSWIIFKPKV